MKSLITLIGALFITYLITASLPVYSARVSQYILSSTTEGTTITIKEIYVWRNWQPIVTRAGKDGGSPLLVKAAFLIENRRDNPVKIHWEAYLEQISDGQTFPIEVWDSNSDAPWSGRVDSHETKNVYLRTFSGPYLEPGKLINLTIDFIVDGELLTIKSKPVKVEASH